MLFLNELELICLHTSVTIVFKQLNGFSYYEHQKWQFNINRLFADSEVVTSIVI